MQGDKGDTGDTGPEGPAGDGDITAVNVGTGLTGGGGSGDVWVAIASAGVKNSMIADYAVSSSKIAPRAVDSDALAEKIDFGTLGSEDSTDAGRINVYTGGLGGVSFNLGDYGGGSITAYDYGGNRTAILDGRLDGGSLTFLKGFEEESVSLSGDGLYLWNDTSRVLLSDGDQHFAKLNGSSGDGGTLSLYAPRDDGDETAELSADALSLTHGDIGAVMLVDGSAEGSLLVTDLSGTITAGIVGATGTVHGLIKSFRVPDPENPGRMIQYASLEDPEAAMYLRGTAELVNGSAYVEFPDHFSAMAVPSSITVTLTPRSARSMGLAAVEVTGDGVEVSELAGGAGNYSFDYLVHSVRKGFEDHKVYLYKDAVAESSSGLLPAASADIAP